MLSVHYKCMHMFFHEAIQCILGKQSDPKSTVPFSQAWPIRNNKGAETRKPILRMICCFRPETVRAPNPIRAAVKTQPL